MIETHSRSQGSIVCAPWGHLDWIGAASLRHVIADVLQPGREVVIDLRHVDSFDGVGLSALVGASRRARSIGCKARFRNATPELSRLLERLGLHWVADPATDYDNDNDAA